MLRTTAPGLVGLQECRGDTDTNQAVVLAEAPGMNSAFIRVGLPPEPEPIEEPDQAGIVMGRGLLSRWPIESAIVAPMPSEGRELAALVATVRHPRGHLRVPNSLPAILLADLNHDREFPAVRNVKLIDGWDAAKPGIDPRTLSSTNRVAPPEAVDQFERRIDHVLYTPGGAGARATRARIIRDEPGAIPPSDHHPVVVDLELPE